MPDREFNIGVGFVSTDGNEREPRALFNRMPAAHAYAVFLSLKSVADVYVSDVWGSEYYRAGVRLGTPGVESGKDV